MEHKAEDVLPALDADQVKAVRVLSNALKACHKVGVRLRGQSGSLTAWNSKYWSDEEPGGLTDDGFVPTVSVQHHGCYVDSGADDMIQGNLTSAGRKAMKALIDDE